MHRLDVYLADGELQDMRLDGESVFPTWVLNGTRRDGDELRGRGSPFT